MMILNRILQRVVFICALIFLQGCLGNGLNPSSGSLGIVGSAPALAPKSPANLSVNFDPSAHFFGGSGCDGNQLTTIMVTNQGEGSAELGTIDVATLFAFGDSGGCHNNSGTDNTSSCIERFINSPYLSGTCSTGATLGNGDSCTVILSLTALATSQAPQDYAWGTLTIPYTDSEGSKVATDINGNSFNAYSWSFNDDGCG